MLAWFLMGLGLRCFQLDTKPIWADEWTTFVFSLGHSFCQLPINQLLSPSELLEPVTQDGASAVAGIRALMNESTHPPLYFWLSHYWLSLWQPSGALITAGVGRSLSALLGAITVPLTYLISRWTQLSPREAHLATAIMGLSPFGVYLAQDARHYTLTQIWCLIALGCTVRSWQALRLGHPLSRKLIVGWILSNGLGLASHYFYSLFLAAQGLAFVGLALQKIAVRPAIRPVVQPAIQPAVQPAIQPAKSSTAGLPAARGVAISALGSGLMVLPWVFFWQRSAQSHLTQWLEQDLSGLGLLAPLGRLFTWFLSMIMLLPIEQVPLAIAILSGLILLGSLLWLLPSLWQSWQSQFASSQPSPPASHSVRTSNLQALVALCSSELLMFFVIIYGFGRDLSLSPRYVFSLSPIVSLLLAILLGHQWPKYRPKLRLVLILGCLGSLTIATGFAYQKADRPDLWVSEVRQYYQTAQAQSGEIWPGDPLSSVQPRALVIAIIQKSHSDTAKLMGIAQAWQAQNISDIQEPSFLLLERNPYTRSATRGLRQPLSQQSHPLDLWVINFSAHANFRDLGCSLEQVTKVRAPGYSAHRYVCNERAHPLAQRLELNP